MTRQTISGHTGDGFQASGTLPLTWKNTFKELGYTLTKAGNIPILADLDLRKTGSEDRDPGDCKSGVHVRGASFDAITMDQDAVVYNDDGTITLKFSK